MATKPKATHRGRPPLSPEQRKRNNVTLRLRDELKQQLEARADASGRSLSEEMEFRLENSLKYEHVAADIYRSFGGLENFAVARVLSEVTKALETTSGEDWRKNPDLFVQVQEACFTILTFFGPKGGMKLSLEELRNCLVDRESEHVGVSVAEKIMNDWFHRTMLANALRNYEADN
jgi:plasmid stability protein